MTHANRLARAVAAVSKLPGPLRTRLITAMFGSQVRFAGTAGVHFEELAPERAILTLGNRRRVRNHIGTVHAAAMALLAESATGAVFGMNVPDSHVPLLKSMRIDYLKRAKGDLRAKAHLTAEQRAQIRKDERGTLTVPVRVTDETDHEPIRCELVWAWVPKQRKEEDHGKR